MIRIAGKVTVVVLRGQKFVSIQDLITFLAAGGTSECSIEDLVRALTNLKDKTG